jgi:hypothetical protein
MPDVLPVMLLQKEQMLAQLLGQLNQVKKVAGSML